jgi:predicted ATPase
MWAYDCALLAEACLQTGQPEEGLRILTEALDVVQHSEGRCYTAELYRLKGEFLLAQAGHGQQGKDHQWEDPAACLQHALTLARRSQAKWWELRAAMSLSRLWQRQGKHDAARQVLAEVYGWFTEGFDTTDLQEAQALLRQLSAAP